MSDLTIYDLPYDIGQVESIEKDIFKMLTRSLVTPLDSIGVL